MVEYQDYEEEQHPYTAQGQDDPSYRLVACARQDKDLSWAQWAERVDEYMQRVEQLFSPDLIIVGGGVSKKHEKFLPLLNTRAQLVPAMLLNDAGIVGAAMAAARQA